MSETLVSGDNLLAKMDGTTTGYATSSQDVDRFDFWTDRLNVPRGGYNEAVDDQIYQTAKLIVEANAAGSVLNCRGIATALGISPEHAELIQYILASVSMPAPQGKPMYAECFSYGTSPRGLFMDDPDMASQFLREFEEYMKKWDAEP